MEEKDKVKYISEMLNKRTKGKSYENFVINQIYARIDNPELEIVTQKCVRIDKSSGIDTKNLTKISKNRYLIDLFFPQIKFAIEVDEGHHENIQNQFDDKVRENFIKKAVSNCKLERIKICNEGTKTPQDFEKVIERINEVVYIVKKEIKKWETKNGKLKWITNSEKIDHVKEHKLFDADEDVHFIGITSILNILLNRNLKLYQKAVKNFDNYSIWVPVLSVKLGDGSIKTANGWQNYISDDECEISEYPSDKSYPQCNTYRAAKGSCPSKWSKTKKVVFMKMTDEFGNRCCRFIGVFKADHIEYEKGKQKRVYKRINTKISFAEIVKSTPQREK